MQPSMSDKIYLDELTLFSLKYINKSVFNFKARHRQRSQICMFHIDSLQAMQRFSFMQIMVYVFQFIKMLLVNSKNVTERMVNVTQVKLRFGQKVQFLTQGRNQENHRRT